MQDASKARGLLAARNAVLGLSFGWIASDLEQCERWSGEALWQTTSRDARESDQTSRGHGDCCGPEKAGSTREDPPVPEGLLDKKSRPDGNRQGCGQHDGEYGWFDGTRAQH